MGKKSKTAKKPKSAAPHLREDVCGLSLVATSAGSEWTFAAKSGALAFTEEAAAFLGGVGERVLEKPIEPERLHALIAPFLRAAAPARPERGAQRGRKARFIAKS